MATSPNQREVRVTLVPKKGTNKPYAVIFTDALERAASTLDPVGLKLYLYCVSNQNNYRFAFSSADVAEKYHCNVKSVQNAFNKLIEQGYLTQSTSQKNLYEFSEYPQEKPITLPVGTLPKKRKFLDMDTGETLYFTYNELVQACGNEETAKQLWNNATD